MRKQIILVGLILVMCGLTFSASAPLALDEEADVSITADASPEVVVTGSNVTYILTIANEGPGVARGVVATDVLPDETTFVSCDATGGGICGGLGNNRTVTFNAIMPDAFETVTLVAVVNCQEPDGDEIGNTASVRSSTPDPDADEDDNETVFITTSNPPPVIAGEKATPSALWPPNHRMVDIRVDYTVIDNCGPIRIDLDVASNEAIDATGDGHTSPDWEVVDEHHVRLRAERAGNQWGRLYTIAITATDSANQSVTQTVAVQVPHHRLRQ
jgi:uncharacterized repeat protein (TIGR01451 family)